jgi:hypothetical protein
MVDIKKLSNFELMKEIGKRASKDQVGFYETAMEAIDKEEVKKELKTCLTTFYWLCVQMDRDATQINKEYLIDERGNYKDIGFYCGNIAKKFKEKQQGQAVQDAYKRGFEAGKKENKIINLYDHFKNTPKRLKIVCDWDEVIQVAWPYVLWLTVRKKEQENKPFGIKYKEIDFTTFFKVFWSKNENNWWEMDYSPHGSDLKIHHQKESWKEKEVSYYELLNNNPDDFYQQAPFLTIAEDLLKLIKEDKIEKLIFLSAGDDRKYEIFRETFYKFNDISSLDDKIILRLLSEEIKINPGARTKCDWIKYNAEDFDVFIDDNPFICKSVIESNNHFLVKPCKDCMKKYMRKCHGETSYSCGNCSKMNITVCSPNYPAVENQHHKEVLLVKNEVSDLKKEDFSKNYK